MKLLQRLSGEGELYFLSVWYLGADFRCPTLGEQIYLSCGVCQFYAEGIVGEPAGDPNGKNSELRHKRAKRA